MAVIVAHAAAGAFFLRREMLYTAVTRAKLATVIVGTRDVVARAARTPGHRAAPQPAGGEAAAPNRLERLTSIQVSTLSTRKRHALELFAGLPRSYHSMGAVLSFRQDPRWRATLVDQVNPLPGQRVLDVATGTGLVALRARATRRRGRRARPEPGHARGGPPPPERAARARGPRHVRRKERPRQLPFDDNEFDALTFTYLLRYVDDRAATMRELARVVKPNGRIGMVEFGVPQAALLRAAWRVYTRAGLPIIGRAVSPAWFEVGRFLGPNIEEFHAHEPDLASLWRRAGIDDITERRLSFGAGLVMWGVRNGRGERAA